MVTLGSVPRYKEFLRSHVEYCCYGFNLGGLADSATAVTNLEFRDEGSRQRKLAEQDGIQIAKMFKQEQDRENQRGMESWNQEHWGYTEGSLA